MQLATANLFRAKWTDQIHDEWISALLKERNDISPDKLKRTRDLMNLAVPDCLVTGYEHIIDTVVLPDKNDRHVVAAAFQARVDAIVTFNLKDFPPTSLDKYNVEAIHPDEFINYQIDLNEAAVVIAAQKCCARLKKPPVTGDVYLDALEAQSLPKTASALRQYASILSPISTNDPTSKA